MIEYTATPSTVLSLRLWRRIGNHYFACWCSVKGQPGMLPTGWEAGNTYWRRFIRRNGRFIFNIESQSECYYYWVYCCTPITVLAVYLSRWRQNATLPSIIVYWRSLHFIPYVTMIGHWARKYNDLCTRILFKKFATNDPLAKSNHCEFLPWKLLHKKPCAIGKDLTVFIKEIGVSRYIGNPVCFNIL